MSTLDEIKILVKAEVNQAITALDKLEGKTDKTRKTTTSMMDKFRSMQAVMQGPIAAFNAVSGAISKVAGEVDKYIMMAAEAEKNQAILNSTLKATGANAWTSIDALNAYASAMADITLFEDDAISGMQGILLGFRNIQGVNFDRASTEILNMAQVMGMDLTSAAQAVGKALDNPIQGLDSLSRQGFKFSAAEKEMIKNLVETNRLADAQDIILKELAKTYGGAAEAAAATATGVYQNLKKEFGEFNEFMGAKIASDFEPLFDLWSRNIKKLTGLLSDAQKAQKVSNIFDPLVGKKFSVTKLEKDMSEAGITWADTIEALTAKYQKLDKTRAAFGKDAGKEINQQIDNTLALLNYAREMASVEAEKTAELKKQADQTAAISKAEEDRLARLKDEQDAYAQMTKEKKEAFDNVMKWAKEQKEQYLKDRMEQIETDAAAADWMAKYFQDVDEEVAKSTEERAKRTAEAWADAYGTIKGAAMDTWGAINDLIENNNDLYLKNLEEQGASEETLKAEKNRLGQQEFNSRKLTSMANIAIATAEGVMNALKYPAPVGPILAGVVTAAGAVQAGTVAAQQYVPMAEGGSGIVTKPTLFLAGEAGPEPFAFGGANNKRGMNMGTTNTFIFQGSPYAIKEAEAVVYSAMAKANRGY